MATLAELQAERARRAPQFTLDQLRAEKERRAQSGIRDISGSVPDTARDRTETIDELFGTGEAALAIGSGILAEPAAGLAGLATGAITRDPEAAAEVVKGVREALTFEPRGEAGRQDLQAVGEALAPIGEVISGAEEFLGDEAFEATGSPAVAALATTLPSAALELIGVKGGGRLAKTSRKLPSTSKVKRAVVDSAPDIETIKNTARGIYDELDNSNVFVKPNAYNQLVDKIKTATRKQGLDKRTTPRAAGAIEVMEDSLGRAHTLTEIDTLRKVANNVAKSPDLTESSLASQIVSEIDDFLDTASDQTLTKGSIDAAEVGNKYRAARQLWGRARRSELINEALERGSRAASGLENGIRNEFNKIINSKKQSRFFPKEELASMQAVVDGDFSKNMLRHMGKFGISFDRSGTNLLAFLGGAGGTAFGGGAMGATVLTLGTAARAIGKTLAKKEGQFTDAVGRAGKNAEKIASAYLTTVPKKQQSVAQLSALLSDPTIDLTKMLKSANKIRREAAEIAQGRRVLGSAIGAATAPALREEE